ncbi:hypothetical protein ACIQMR_07120 [Streptomyces sp. NPDC091376]|uniref:hypothetical protein n=1 Tax=Streptomyces sp. NPDC091376 TaxID=3365994 RepID=UPI00380A9FC9
MTTQSSARSASPGDATPTVARQPDGLGMRVGDVAEITVLFDVKPGGAERFRQNAAKIQNEAWYYEKIVGTVHDFRVAFINNDTQVIGAVTYDGDFKTYIADIFSKAGPWFDEMFDGVIEGYPGASDPGVFDWLAPKIVEADMWYASNPTMTVQDTAKAQKVTEAFNALLDTASA